MNQIDIHNEFIKALENKIPKKALLVDFIAKTLYIEKETAYRRLRGEVLFSFKEAILIAGKLHISIDEIMIKTELKRKDRNNMQLPLYTHNLDQAVESKDIAINFLKDLTAQPYSEYGMAMTQMTFPLFFQYNSIPRFHIFKHIHHAGNPDEHTPFEKIQEPIEFTRAKKEFSLLYRQISYTYYIWDVKIIPSLCRDIQYFKHIHLIKEAEVCNIKKELHLFLNDLEQLAAEGKYKETGNNFELYISDLSIDMTYAYLWSIPFYISATTSFINHITTSQDKATFQNIRDWIKSLKRCSSSISGSGTKDRIDFFKHQHEIVDTILQLTTPDNKIAYELI